MSAPTRSTSTLRRAILAAGAAFLAACASDAATAPAAGGHAHTHEAGAPAAGPVDHAALAAVRGATAKYHRVDVALADGYVNTGECVASPAGGMGVHFVHPGLMGAPIPGPGGEATIDPLRPEVLVYEPQENGQYRLVAVEWLVWRASWDAANPGHGPEFAGQPFDQSFGEQAHGLPDHYELHAWVWQQNPSGMFAPFNPKVACR